MIVCCHWTTHERLYWWIIGALINTGPQWPIIAMQQGDIEGWSLLTIAVTLTLTSCQSTFVSTKYPGISDWSVWLKEGNYTWSKPLKFRSQTGERAASWLTNRFRGRRIFKGKSEFLVHLVTNSSNLADKEQTSSLSKAFWKRLSKFDLVDFECGWLL